MSSRFKICHRACHSRFPESLSPCN
jgi:hypothetical protein